VIQSVCNQGSLEHEVLKDAQRFINHMKQQGHPVDIDAITASGMTALTQCALDGSLRSVKILVELGANVNKKDGRDWTPLHYAASEGYLEIVRFLLRCEANVQTKNLEGDLPVDLADEEAVKDLLTRVTLFLTPTGTMIRRRLSLPAGL
jgi:ankyrin repeat protein